jgi:hypothetical protein
MSEVNIGYINGMLDMSEYRFPSTAKMVLHGDHYAATKGTVYGFACSDCEVTSYSGKRFYTWQVNAGMFFCVPAPCRINVAASGGSALAINIKGFVGMFSIGGPVERCGRLRYIDMCSDTLIVPPLRVGDPCLNHLHFPKHISQTMHTHPSVRIGTVFRGSGVCVTPDNCFDLKAGMMWVLPEGAPHRFVTGDETMDIIAWHPDSDTGPNDTDHPMINRTIVNGVPASKLPNIQTTGGIVE